MVAFADDKARVEFVERILRQSKTTRQARLDYAVKCRARYSGIQWIQRGQGPDGFLRWYFPNESGQTWTDVYKKNEPMLTTLNKTTKAVITSAAATNWNDLVVSATPAPGSMDADDMVRHDIVEVVANAAIDLTGLVHHAEAANFERYIDGMHGVGVRLRRQELQPGMYDYDMEAFDFDGYQLALDPTAKSQDLRDHPYVVFSEAITWESAKARYGASSLAGINEKNLPSLANLLPTEVAFYAMSRGTLYTHLQDCVQEKAIRVHEVFVRGARRRFDEYFIVLDGTGSNGKVVIRPEKGNPYGGCGLPLALKYGDRRPGEIFGISLVGMMSDAQDKINAIESLFFQQLWAYTTNAITYVNKGWFGNNRASDEEIRQSIESGFVIGNGGPGNRFDPPTIVTRPAPSAAMGQETSRYIGELRESAGHTPMHSGQVKTHIADASHQTALELVEMPEDDRREADARSVQAVIEVAAATLIRAVQGGSPTIIDALDKAGVNENMFGEMLNMDPNNLRVSLKINPESIRRRSRGQAARDLERFMQYGANENPVVRAALAELDFPVFESDKKISRWANQAVARVLNGYPYEPVPVGQMLPLVQQVIREAMMSDKARNPQVRAALDEAWLMQMEAEMAYDGVPAPMDPAMAEEESAAQPAPMDQLFGRVSLSA